MLTALRPAAFSRIVAPSTTGVLTGSSSTSRRARLRACAQPGAMSPLRPVGVRAQSPIALMCGSLVRSSASTTTPRSTSRPVRRASSVSGTEPTASTSRSVGRRRPSERRTARSRPRSCTSDATLARGTKRTPRSRTVREATSLAAVSRSRSSTPSRLATRATSRSRWRKPQATSTPMAPAPTTVTRRALAAPARMARASSTVRSTWTPLGRSPEGSSRPGSAGTRARAPVASTRWSYAVVRPSDVRTVRASRSTSTARTPSRRSAAPGDGRVRPETLTRPATSSESMTRLYGSYCSSPSTTTSASGWRSVSSWASRWPTMPAPTTTVLIGRPPQC